MTTSNVPQMKGSTVAEPTKTTDSKAADAKPATSADKPAEKPAPRRQYARAAESGDPEVQRLLAQREAHVMNSQPDPSFAAQREAADRAVKDIDERLNELGYTAE